MYEVDLFYIIVAVIAAVWIAGFLRRHRNPPEGKRGRGSFGISGRFGSYSSEDSGGDGGGGGAGDGGGGD